MGATLIVDDPELAPVLSGTPLSTLERWKFAQQHKVIGRSVGMTSMENQTWVAHIVGQWFTYHTTGV